jgi:hypothetical protein
VLAGIATIAMAFFGGSVYSNTTSKHIQKEVDNPTPAPTTETINPFTFCNRTTPYNMEPKFLRALNLLVERTGESNPRNKNLMLRFYLPPIVSCLNIQYCSQDEMQGADGLFSFSKETANRENLQICVSRDYAQEDDLLTSTLIAHEATHAVQFVLDSTNSSYGQIYNKSCFGKETMAFTEEVLFTMSLTNGELQSLYGRMVNLSNINPRIGGLRDLTNLAIRSTSQCDGTLNPQMLFNCFVTHLATDIDMLVKQNSYYQTECS